MSSIYMPDDRISMFPDNLSAELLSLGAKKTSYAISCGVTLDENGAVTSYEVCPSKIQVTHKLSYILLDEILQLGKNNSTTSDNENNSNLMIENNSDRTDNEVSKAVSTFSRGRQEVLASPYLTSDDSEEQVHKFLVKHSILT